jgi:hypothetical protein
MLLWLKKRIGLYRVDYDCSHAVVATWDCGRVVVTGTHDLDAAICLMNHQFHHEGAEDVHVWARPPQPYSWKRG